MTGRELLQEASVLHVDIKTEEPVCGSVVHINHHLLAAARKHAPWPVEALVEAQKILCASLGWKNMFDRTSRGLDSFTIRQMLAKAAQ